MKIFYNDLRSGYEEVSSYGPSYWLEYKEMDAVYRLAGWTLDLMAHFLERMIGNQFVQYADEKTLSMFDQVLGLQADNLTVEERRRAIAAALLGYGKLSAEDIIAIVRAYTGSDCTLNWDGTELKLIIDNTEVGISYPGLIEILSNRLPAHIYYSLRIPYETQMSEYVGMAHNMTTHMVIYSETLNYMYLREYVGIGHVMRPNIIVA